MAPQLLPFSFGEGSLTWGEPITVQCMTTAGDLPMTLRWMFHGQELSSQMGISTLRVNPRVSLLSIDSVAAGHAGVYTCTAENAAGQSNQSASLSVNGLLIKSTTSHFQLQVSLSTFTSSAASSFRLMNRSERCHEYTSFFNITEFVNSEVFICFFYSGVNTLTNSLAKRRISKNHAVQFWR